MNEDKYKFIYNHIKENVSELKLKFSSIELNFDLDNALLQIECRQKYADKLSPFLNCKIAEPYFEFPTRLAAEQASDHRVAMYHAGVAKALVSKIIENANGVKENVISVIGDKWDIQNNEAKCCRHSNYTFLDMTSGLGIDAITLAQNGLTGYAIDIENIKTEALRHNSNILNLTNLTVICEDSVNWLKDTDKNFDIIFIDPARRGENNRRLYSLSDCTPDVTTIINLLLTKGKIVMIKASPLLDITQILRELSQIIRIDIVSVKGECKEVLITCMKDEKHNIENLKIHCTDIEDSLCRMTSIPYIALNHPSEIIESVDVLEKYEYIYQPSVSVMKVNAASFLCKEYFGLIKGASNTNLYFSEKLISDFPGRTFKIISVIDRSNKKSIKGEARNIISRNYPLSPSEIARKYHVREHASERDFLIGCRVGKSETPVLLDTTLFKINKN